MGSSVFERRCAFVFAHYDDSILDAAQAMMRCAPGSIDIVLCSGVPERTSRGRTVEGSWDLTCGYPDPWTAMEARVAEHDNVCRSFSIATAGLGDLDSQYGTSGSATRLAARTAAVAHLRANDIEVVVTHGPWATHPDHVRASRLAISAAQAVGVPVMTVCDRPYTDCSDGCTRASFVGNHMTTTLDDDQWRTKSDAVGKYAGQLVALTASFGEGWADRSRLGVECAHEDVTRSPSW